jgi:hypothetical protein
MSEHANTSTLREVRGTFANSDQMQKAVDRLGMSGFDRAEISMPTDMPGGTLADNSEPVSTEEDARQMRTLGVSTAASVAALAAAGVTVATGGAALPAVAAAVAAGGAVGGADFAMHTASDRSEQQKRDDRAAEGSLLLAVRTPTETKRQQAEQILREAGARSIETVG